MQITKDELRIIGPTIHAVAKAHSQRFKKEERNTAEHNHPVFLAIEAEVAMSLAEAGIPWSKIVTDIRTTDIICGQMEADGYVLPEDCIEEALWETAPLVGASEVDAA